MHFQVKYDTLNNIINITIYIMNSATRARREHTEKGTKHVKKIKLASTTKIFRKYPAMRKVQRMMKKG